MVYKELRGISEELEGQNLKVKNAITDHQPWWSRTTGPTQDFMMVINPLAQ